MRDVKKYESVPPILFPDLKAESSLALGSRSRSWPSTFLAVIQAPGGIMCYGFPVLASLQLWFILIIMWIWMAKEIETLD